MYNLKLLCRSLLYIQDRPLIISDYIPICNNILQLHKVMETIDAASSGQPSQLKERKHNFRATHEARNCCQDYVKKPCFS